ncbi:serine hydrolase [Bosea sp. (in: a-proteobacteria)]|uniref:serine hydrolase n=1 Tax=Bosea sp. (in: a-proteobacteria) TaxID=1871050 RepID=UPI002605AB88|nr:serine hydrolase [Bosea sp. (in: a-proteobacteria)]MCO5093500.1 class A beta-lactamase-related serine hydrolase [Bosea sp. (in: a-proteobacteria)]
MRANLEAEIRRIASSSEGEVGVAARHMESGRSFTINDDRIYPLASTVKLALALAILDAVDRGDLSLQRMVDVETQEMNPSEIAGIGDLFFRPGVSLSIRNLLEGMITRSCNTSTDVLFRVAGGPKAVAHYLKRLGVTDFECTRTMREALCILHELPLPPDDVSVVQYLAGQPQHVLDARNRTNAAFHHDRRDQARPSAMLELLRRIWEADGVSEAARRALLEIMSRTVTAVDRVQARLPFGIPFASKGGSGAGTAVDVGYLTLPPGQGTVALAIFVKASPLDMASRNRIIADIARLIADYFIITSERHPPPPGQEREGRS